MRSNVLHSAVALLLVPALVLSSMRYTAMSGGGGRMLSCDALFGSQASLYDSQALETPISNMIRPVGRNGKIQEVTDIPRPVFLRNQISKDSKDLIDEDPLIDEEGTKVISPYEQMIRLSDELTQAYRESPQKSAALIQTLVIQDERTRLLLEKSIKPIPFGGGISQELPELRSQVRDALTEYSFEGANHVVRIKRSSLPVPFDQISALGHILVQGNLSKEYLRFGRDSEKKGAHVFARFQNYLNARYELELDWGIPIRVWFPDYSFSIPFLHARDMMTPNYPIVRSYVLTLRTDQISEYSHLQIEIESDSKGSIQFAGGRPTLVENSNRVPWLRLGLRHPWESGVVDWQDGLIHSYSSRQTDDHRDMTLIWDKRPDQQKYVTCFHISLPGGEKDAIQEWHQIRNLRSTGIYLQWRRRKYFKLYGKAHPCRLDVDGINPTGKKFLILHATDRATGQEFPNQPLYFIYKIPEGLGAGSFRKGIISDYYEDTMRPLKLEDENGKVLSSYIAQVKTSPEGDIRFLVSWGGFQQFPNADVEVKTINGKKSFIKFIADEKGAPILDSEARPIIFDIRERTGNSAWPWPEKLLGMHWVAILRVWQTVELPALQKMDIQKRNDWFRQAFATLVQIASETPMHPAFLPYFNQLLLTHSAKEKSQKALEEDFGKALDTLLKKVDDAVEADATPRVPAPAKLNPVLISPIPAKQITPQNIALLPSMAQTTVNRDRYRTQPENRRRKTEAADAQARIDQLAFFKIRAEKLAQEIPLALFNTLGNDHQPSVSDVLGNRLATDSVRLFANIKEHQAFFDNLGEIGEAVFSIIQDQAETTRLMRGLLSALANWNTAKRTPVDSAPTPKSAQPSKPLAPLELSGTNQPLIHPGQIFDIPKYGLLMSRGDTTGPEFQKGQMIRVVSIEDDLTYAFPPAYLNKYRKSEADLSPGSLKRINHLRQSFQIEPALPSADPSLSVPIPQEKFQRNPLAALPVPSWAAALKDSEKPQELQELEGPTIAALVHVALFYKKKNLQPLLDTRYIGLSEWTRLFPIIASIRDGYGALEMELIRVFGDARKGWETFDGLLMAVEEVKLHRSA